jgi:prephenate dehydratase
VQTGTATHGVVPFENSSNGSVVFTLDLLADVSHSNPDIVVIGEAYVSVRHCLLGHQTSSSTDFGGIAKLYSHPQAWGQCNKFLSKHFEGVERQDVASTSKAAELVSSDKSGSSAALSSPAAAQVFGLDVLAEGINDQLGNTTRFLIIQHANRKSPITPPLSVQEAPGSSQSSTLKIWKSLVTFTVEHGNPGTLAQCLSVFSNHGINLTSINTRPSGQRNWHYIFFVEFEGRAHGGEGKRDEAGNVDKALKKLAGVAKDVKFLGSWENQLVEDA